ncbi:MAG TPA: YggT family protein [Candidatus Paceibacterota bacterium]|nr:YggT family protein [Candidatus Paceibacterota bacterium]
MAIYTYADSRTRPLYRGTQIVWYVLGILEALLALRFVLRLLGANPAAGFSTFIYGITYPFLAPFMAVFHTTRLAGSAFDWSTLLAMLIYWLLALAIIRLFLISKPVSRTEAAVKLENQA